MPKIQPKQLDKDIFSLLAISRLSLAEKEVWLEVLPYLTEDEKHRLKDNLEQQVRYERTVKEEAVKKFIEALGT